MALMAIPGENDVEYRAPLGTFGILDQTGAYTTVEEVLDFVVELES